MLVSWPAYMLPPKNDQLVGFYERLADASPVPVIAYDIPSRLNGTKFGLDLLVRLAQHPNIVGAKLSSSNSRLYREVGEAFFDSRFAILAGNQHRALVPLVLGHADGVIASGANIDPALWAEICVLRHQEKDRLTEELLVQLQERIKHHHELYCSPECSQVGSEVAFLKARLVQMGILHSHEVVRPDTEVDFSVID